MMLANQKLGYIINQLGRMHPVRMSCSPGHLRLEGLLLKGKATAEGPAAAT